MKYLEIDDSSVNLNDVLKWDGTKVVFGNGGGGGGVSDHGALTGLSDDDHTQYHNDTRGDARYYTQAQVDSALSGKAASSHSHIIGDVTSLQGYIDEIEAARGDRSSLNLRISTISNFASPNAGGIVAGRYYDNAFQGTASTTLASAANRINLVPFYTSQTLAIDQLGVAISTAAAGAARAVIYDSDSNGWPDSLLLTVDQSDTGTTGWKGASCTFTFDSGRQYWLGIHTAAAPTYRAINVSSAVNLGLNGNAGTSYYSMLRRTVTYASGAPSTWTFTSTDLVTGNPPSIRFRAA